MSTQYDKSTVIAELIAWAQIPCDESEFEEAHVSATSPRLHEAALELFGTWQRALGAAIVAACVEVDSDDEGDDEPINEPPFDASARVASGHQDTRLLCGSNQGELAALTLSALPVRMDGEFEPLTPQLEFAASLSSVSAHPEDDSFVALSRGGEIGNLIAMQFTAAAQVPTSGAAKLRQRISGLNPPTELASLMPRRQLRLNERIAAVSLGGQIKSSKASEYASRVGSDAVPMIIPKEGDAAGWLLALDERDEILVASSAGRAIVFPMSEVRAQGLKAQGVRAISLDEGATVVGAFNRTIADKAFVISREGYAKRIGLGAFRAQGRGGAGMQTARLYPNDVIAVLGPVRDEDDVLVITSHGRYLRTPAPMLPLMGRPARGERLGELEPGEHVVNAYAVPAGPLEV